MSTALSLFVEPFPAFSWAELGKKIYAAIVVKLENINRAPIGLYIYQTSNDASNYKYRTAINAKKGNCGQLMHHILLDRIFVLCLV